MYKVYGFRMTRTSTGEAVEVKKLVGAYLYRCDAVEVYNELRGRGRRMGKPYHDYVLTWERADEADAGSDA